MKHKTKCIIVIREDNPEKNKIGVYKYIERIVYHGEYSHYIHYKGYTWYVHFNGWNNGKAIYQLGGIKNL